MASIEIKSINHRYLDINMRLPEMLRSLEMPLRQLIRQQVQRGKIDYTLRYTAGSAIDAQVLLNEELVDAIIMTAERVATKMTNPRTFSAMDILHWSGVTQVADADLGVAHTAILDLTQDALRALNQTREREGAALVNCIGLRLDDIEKQIMQLKPRSAEVVEQQYRRLQEKISDLKVELDADRLAQETALMAQRLDIVEELDRLTTHVKETRYILGHGGAVGRRLDFLMQELNREANTVASKSVDTQMTKAVVEIKVLIEQIREQIQNIE